MEIIKIKIENFKSFDSEEVIINKHINHFIGINGVGKSNFLKAIEFFGNEETNFVQNAKDLNKDINISFELKLNELDIKLVIEEVIKHWFNFSSSFLNTLKNEAENWNEQDKDSFFDEDQSTKDITLNVNPHLLIKQIENDLDRIKKLKTNIDFNNNFLLSLFEYFKEENLIISKTISKSKIIEFKILSTAKANFFRDIIINFSDFFKIDTIESLIDENQLPLLINAKNQSPFTWFDFFKMYSDKYILNNPSNTLAFKEVFIIDLRKLINIVVWNKKIINFDQDAIFLSEESNHLFLNNLLSMVGLNVSDLLSIDSQNDVLDRKESELNKVINSSIYENWKDFKDEKLRIKFRITNKFVKIIFKNSGQSNDRGVKIESEGFKQFLSIILSLDFSANSKKTILIIDEPEIHLHPSSIISLRNILNNSSKNYLNFFIATHSVQMIDKDNLYTLNLVKKENQNTKINNVVEGGENMEIPDILKQAFGTDIFSEFLFKKYTFFVEGKTDKIFLVKFLKEHNISANVLIYFGSRGLDIIGSMKENFYEDYFMNNCFFLSDGDQEGVDFQGKLKEKFGNVKAFTLSELLDKKNEITIENLYSENLFKEYQKTKEKITKEWEEVKEYKKNDKKFNLEKAKKSKYNEPLNDLKIKLSEKIEQSNDFSSISNKENIQKLIKFLKGLDISIS